MDVFFTSSGLIALITLTFLEIVLGVDNVIFISILTSKLPGSQQSSARRMGLLAAMGMRIPPTSGFPTVRESMTASPSIGTNPSNHASNCTR
jgi:predicted tellurium resistance membrane protein TerC